jgi:CheY-like chemotaxis protein
MALNGRLEDMNLLEILQIVAFSKKTGTLRVESPMATGAVLFRDGRVLHTLCSRPEGLTPDNDFVDPPSEATVRATLRELFALREGRFEFRLVEALPARWEGIDVSELLALEGIDPQELMLELARELDEDRKDTFRLLESTEGVGASRPSAESEDGFHSLADVTVVLVDDEPMVLRALEREIASAGPAVETANGTEEAWELVDSLLRSGRPLVLVTDLSMLTSAHDSFEGGFEIVEKMRKNKARAPVILMAESLSSEVRVRARELGVHKVAFKPALTKLDPEEYESDLAAFGRLLTKEIASTMAESALQPPSAEPDLNYDVIFDFLKTMTDQLTSPANGISRMILRVASRYVERCLVFLIRGGRATGLAGIHHGRPAARVVEKVREMSFDIQEVQGFAEVVYTRRAVRFDRESELWPDVLEPGRAREVALFPLLHSHETLAILCCDNPNTGTALGKLSGLELFLVQAGMALENASLHRKLDALSPRYTIEDQGPLTQELNPLVRGDG